MAKTVVILGASLAGLHVAHALLKKHDGDRKVILVSKNTHFYWNLASVRAIIPGKIKDEDIFKPLSTALAHYPPDSYELVIGTATVADFVSKKVDINISADNTSRTLSYDQLILATGARSASPTAPWKANGSYEEAIDCLHQTAARAKDAKHIVVAGAGATGVEVAGELGYEYGKTKEIVLFCATDKVLGGDRISAAAARELGKLNVTIKYGAHVESTQPAPSSPDKTEIVLTTGETWTTDLYLPTTGMVPNTEYVPAQYLSTDLNHPTVLVDQDLRVQGTLNVWACGDVVGRPRAGLFFTQKQAAAVARNVELVLAGMEPVVAKAPAVDIFACAVGCERGVGRMGSIKLPSFGIWLAKGRTLGMQMVRGYIDGGVA